MIHKLIERGKSGYRAHRAILIVMALLLVERLIAMCALGMHYNLHSDDWSYIVSGIVFANTGRITMHGTLSAQIMPGMPLLLGLVSFIFGEGRLYLLVLKLLWIAMGTLTAWFIYRSVCLFAPKWCGVAASLALFAPNIVWLDQLIMTETPYVLCSAAMIYYTFRMGRFGQRRDFWLCAVFYLLSLSLKANVGIYPVFAAFYLLLVRYDLKKLLRQGILLGCLVALMLAPWTVRNYKNFHAFIPLTYGGGNPLLLGTYQSSKAPEDASLDYAANVDAPIAEKFADYYNADGEVKEDYYARYISLERDAVKAKYRMREWFHSDPKGFLRAYLMDKPAIMVYRVYYEENIFGLNIDQMNILRMLTCLATIACFALAFVLRRRRSEMLFLAALYVGNIYLYAYTFAFPRYGQTLVHIWFILCGIGLPLAAEAFRRAGRQLREE